MATDGGPDAAVTGQLLAFVEGTSDLVGVVDEQSRIRYLNAAARKRLGVGDSPGLTTADLFPPQTFARYYDEIRPALLRTGTWHGELAVLTASGEAVPMTMTIVADIGPGGEVNGLVTHGRELDTRVGTTGRAALAADELTGLAGPAILEDRVSVALSHALRDGRTVAVIAVGVVAMSDILESFGPAAGDDVLRGLARAMSTSVRSCDTVARTGSAEFVVLVDGLDDSEEAEAFAERLRDAVCNAPIAAGNHALGVTINFGLAVATPDETAPDLLQRADVAMRHATTTGRVEVVARANAADASLATLADELAVAVSHGLIQPHVQALVDLQSGVLVGYQGLARWEHPRRGLLEAEQFVDIVANTPALSVVDLAVLRRTAAAAARTARSGLHVRAYGHLSRRLIGDIDFERYLTQIVEDLRLAPSDLCVEIAHSLITRPSRRIQRAIHDLRDTGVRTVLSAVDGECDVNQIVEHGFHQLRLAPRLVHDAGHDPTRRRVAHGTIALARALGLTVIAVGIETDAQRVDMRDAGCDYGQGNLFGPVQPAGTID